MATRYNSYTEQFEDVDEAEQPTATGQMMRPDLGAVEDVEMKTSELPWWAATAEERAANERRSAPVSTGPGTTTAAARSDDPFSMGLAGVMVGRPALDQQRLAEQRTRDDAADAAAAQPQGAPQGASQDPGAPVNPGPQLPQGPGQIKQSVTNTTTSYRSLSKEDQKKQDALDKERETNVNEQLQNAEDAKNLNVDVARQRYANKTTEIGEKEKLAQQLQQIQDDHNSKVRAAEGQLDAEILEQKRLAAEANKDFWGSRTTAERLRGAVLIMAGGIAQGMQSIGGGVKGAENVGLNIVNKEVEDSIARAKQAVTDQKEMVGFAKERVNRARDAKKEALADYSLMRAARLDIVGDQLEAEILKRGGDAAAIDGNKALQTIRKQAIDERQAALDKRLRTITSQTRSQVLQVTGSLAGGGDFAPKDPRTIYGPGGVPLGTAATDKRAEEINEGTAGFREADMLMGQLSDHLKQHGWQLNPKSDAYQDRERLTTQLMGLLNRQYKFGALDKGSQKALMEIIGGTFNNVTGDPRKIDGLRESMRAKQVAAFDSLGINGARAVNTVLNAPLGGPQPQGQGPQQPAAPQGKRVRYNGVTGTLVGNQFFPDPS